MKIFKNRKLKIGLLIFGIIIFLFAGLFAYKIKTCGCKKKVSYSEEGIVYAQELSKNTSADFEADKNIRENKNGTC